MSRSGRYNPVSANRISSHEPPSPLANGPARNPRGSGAARRRVTDRLLDQLFELALEVSCRGSGGTAAGSPAYGARFLPPDCPRPAQPGGAMVAGGDGAHAGVYI